MVIKTFEVIVKLNKKLNELIITVFNNLDKMCFYLFSEIITQLSQL